MITYIVKEKWHLHFGLCYVAIVITTLFGICELFNLAGGIAVAAGVEIWQSIYYGTRKTKEARLRSNLDFVVSVSGVILSIYMMRKIPNITTIIASLMLLLVTYLELKRLKKI